MMFARPKVSLLLLPAALAGLAASSSITLAGNGVWRGTLGVNFADAGNWGETAAPGTPLSSAPGAVGTLNSPDTINFNGNTPGAATAITVDAGRNILNISATSGGPAMTFSGAPLVFSNAGGISISGGTKTYTFNGGLSFAGSAALGASATAVINVTGPLTFSSVNGNGAQTLTLQGPATTVSTLSQGLSDGSGTGNTTALIKSNASTWALLGASTHTGGTTLSGGTLAIGNNAALGAAGFTFNATAGIQSTDATTRTFANSVVFAGTGTPTYTFGATVGGTGDLSFSNLASTSIGSLTRAFAVNNNTSFAGAFTGTGSIVKSLNGALTLGGNNAYTGTTTVNGGSLLISGNTVGQGDYNVTVIGTTAATPLLGGAGSVGLASGKSLNVIGGVGAGSLNFTAIVSPGDTAGTADSLAIGSNANNNIVFGNQSLLAIDLVGDSADLLAITGNLDLSSIGDGLTVNASGTQTQSRYVIATYSGTLTGLFNNVTMNGLVGATVDYSVANEIAVVVPEPTTLAFLGLAGLGLLTRRRGVQKA